MAPSGPAGAFGGVDRRKLRNMGWIFLQQGTSVVAGFALMIFLARHLGPDRLAAYAWIFSLAMLASPLAISVESLITRRLVESPDDAPQILGSGLVLHMGGAVAGVLLVLAFAWANRPDGVSLAAVLIGVLILPTLAFFTFDGWFRADERIAVVAVPKSLAVGFGAACGLGLVFAGAGLVAFLWLRVVQSFAAGLASAAWYRVQGSFRGLEVSRSELALLFRDGWPLIVAGATSIAHLKVDQIMLGSMAPLSMLADYSLAARLAETVAVFQVALSAAFYPSLVRAFKRAPGDFDAHMQRFYDLHALTGYLGAAILALAAVALFVPMFGETYGGGVTLLCILALAVPAQLLSGARGAMLTIRGWVRTALAVSCVALLLNVLANVVLIPTQGATGAAWATVGSTWLTCLALPFLIHWLQPFGKGALNALVPWKATPRVMALAGKAE